VLVTVSDKKIAVDSDNDGVVNYYNADVVTANDYYPGGMLMPGRKYSNGGSYRYSINGQEKESELNENITTALYWEYDSRISRRWNVDPVLKVWESPYLCFSGNPILMSDPDGDVSSGGGGGEDPPKKKLPWYLRENKHGGKPVLTFGAKNLVTATVIPATAYSGQSSQTQSGIFAYNVLAKAWNGIASSWNNALDGQTGTDQLRETVQVLEKKTVSDLKKIETYEDIGAFALTAYAFKKISSAKFKLSADLPPGTVTNGFSLSKSVGKVPLNTTPLVASKIANGCEALAAKVHKAIGGQLLQITPERGVRLGEVSYPAGKHGMQQISSWGYHVAVIKEGMVYDAMTGSKGMHLADYKQLFTHNEAINFTPVSK
jgi:hypothetical protein